MRVNPDGPGLGRAHPTYELAERCRAIAHGGIGAVLAVAERSRPGRADQFSAVTVLALLENGKSDHVLNIAINACGGGSS